VANAVSLTFEMFLSFTMDGDGRNFQDFHGEYFATHKKTSRRSAYTGTFSNHPLNSGLSSQEAWK
jgi:hypothetical protein